jgi:RHS repeat-associated protein
MRRYQACEERDATGTLTKKFFDRGQMNSTTKYFYDLDHLGSISEMTDNSGVIQAQYAFDPYGKVTKFSENIAADFGYCNYYLHARSSLNMTRTRAYHAQLGRWINRDPIAERGGLNLFAYVLNDPIDSSDPSGLGMSPPKPPNSNNGGYVPPDFCNCFSEWCCNMNEDKCISECMRLRDEKRITTAEGIKCFLCCSKAGESCRDEDGPRTQGGHPGSDFKDCLEPYRGRKKGQIKD